jgi:hypothetical protein
MVELVRIAMGAVESMFFIGIAGSTVVLLLTAIEDIETLFGSNEFDH